ncbi:MAG: hypothetical protein A2X56_02595 [Nitrospirae bacterium GWC2_57_13]|nr:MAG: hypothetical protein A2072_05130 [Nitrospirae bacterium GWC1_57_7]OGW28588.1 MAG: hypothetical protein A2X56_02595 [Nitrospirae bacterium GWC2_57_13]OGW42248.1 MAG: hypothetical protein A2X57_08955 [Nitrospirae bacterium GWD2_57_8]
METQKGVVELVSERVWKFFSSVKLAVVLLIVLAIVSIIGTVIQQNQPVEQYLQEYSPATVNIFEFLGFFDMYHSWWFVLLLFLFTANLTVCTLERFPRALSAIRAPLKPIDDEALKAVPFKKELQFKGGADKAEARAVQALQSRRYRFLSTSSPGMVQLYSQKGAYSRLGVYITHISIILIFVGALTGAFFGFKGFLNLGEGEHSQVVYLRNEPMWDKLMSVLGVSKSSVIQDPQSGVARLPLGFFIRCNDFEVDYYQGPSGPTGMPSEYHSELTVFNLQGAKIFDKRIEVNDPLKYRGITFYQSSYGTIPGVNGKIVLNVRPKSGESKGEMVVLDPGGEAYVRSIDRTIKALGVSAFGARHTSTGEIRFFQSRNDELVNPTVGLEIYQGKKALYTTTVLKVDQGEPYMPEGYVISYVDYWGARYTGLQVTRDPGVWIVYTGFLLLCIGPIYAFFGSHQKLWIRIQDRKGQAVVTVAATANRNRLALERQVNALVEELSK